MRVLAMSFFFILGGLWYYFAWKYLHGDMVTLMSNNLIAPNNNSLVVLMLLAGMFVFGVLIGKLLTTCKNNEEQDDYFSHAPYTKNKEEFLPEIEEINENEDQNYFSNLNESSKDNLQIIEGIGPKIETLLNENGIHTYRDLMNAPHKNISKILKKGGSRFALHNPKTWGKQAKFAQNGDFSQLEEYQNNLNKGV